MKTILSIKDVEELNSVSDIRARYKLPGSHACMMIKVSKPGDISDSYSTRLNAGIAELRHAGASQEMLSRCEQLVDSLEPTGDRALIIVSESSAAYRRLTTSSSNGMPVAESK